MKKTILTLAACIFLTCSCGIYGSYSRPAGIVPDAPADDLVALPSWREVFTDPLLQALTDSALIYNTDLQTSLLRVNEAESALKAAGLSFLPSASATASAALPSEVASLTGSASWQVDIFGKLRNANRQAEMTLEQSRSASQAVRTAVIAAVADSYYSLLALDARLKIYDETLQNWDKTLTVLEALKLAGRSNDVAILQSRARKLSLEASVVEAKKNVAVAENALRCLIGKSSIPMERGELESAEIPSSRDLSFTLQSLASRPDVRAKEMALASAYYGTAAARSAFYPSLTISGSLGYDFNDILTSALASLVQPLFQRGKLTSDLEMAAAREKEAYLAFSQALLDAGSEVSDAILCRDAAIERLDIDSEQIAALSDAEEKIDLMMKYTSTSYLEVLNAKQSLLDARLVMVGDRLSLIHSEIRLFEALGGGAQ